MAAPASLVAVPLLAGCWIGLFLANRTQDPFAFLLAAAATLAWLAACAWHGDEPAGAAFAIVLGSTLAGASLGLTAGAEALRPPLLVWFTSLPDEARGRPVLLEGVLRQDASATDYGASIEVDVTGVGEAGGVVFPCCRGGVRLSVTGEAATAAIGEWRRGRTVRLHATLRLPGTYRNPGLADARVSLALRGIALVGSVKSAALVEVVSPGGWGSEAAAGARAWIRGALHRHVGRFSARSAAIATAILINDRSGLDPDDERRLQEAGTYHVIAISGGNIAILTVLILALCRAIGIGWRAAPVVAILLLLFYGHLTGAPASVGRAISAAVVFLLARILDQRGPPLNALAVAAIVTLAAGPATAVDPGFLLSFGATLGLLLGTPRLVAVWARPLDEAQGRRRRRRTSSQALRVSAAGLLAASLCAELALMPIGAATFGRVTAAGLLVNFAAVPLMTLTQLAAIATVALEAVGEPAADLAGFAAHAAAYGLVESARLIDVAPWLTRVTPRPGWTLIVVYYAALLWLLRARRTAWASAAVAIAYALVAIGPLPAARDAHPAQRGRLRAVFLDVGQGDATLVTLPDGRSLLVDAGGIPNATFDIGRRVVAPALLPLGVSRLDDLIVTHPDADHIGGALAVVRLFAPPVVREGTPVPPNPERRALERHASASGIAWRQVQAGDAERIAGVDIRVWHPPLPDWERQRVRNDDSIVLEFRYGDVSLVLPGDIGREPEALLAARLQLAPLVVLKAPHHGSATSSTWPFIRTLVPAAVIFSTGRDNPFGHPAAVVVERYHRTGAAVFNTATDGAVFMETDGRTVEIRTFEGRRTTLER